MNTDEKDFESYGSVFILLSKDMLKVKLKCNWSPLFLTLDIKKQVMYISCSLLVFMISFPQLYAYELTSKNNITSSNADFFPNNEKTNILINDLNVSLAIASTNEQRIQGLSGLEKMNENEGMLFLFENSAKHGIWMNNMNFPIDIIWLDLNNRVVHIEKEVEPCKLYLVCPVYAPQIDSLYVIELRSGFADDHSINNHTIINFDIPTVIDTNNQ